MNTKTTHPILGLVRLFSLCLTVCISVISGVAQTTFTPGTTVKFFKDSPFPQAVVLSATSGTLASQDGAEFKPLKVGEVLNQGAIIRTVQNGTTDLFFRRLATTVRLTGDSELKLEKMLKFTKDNGPATETMLDLRKGRIFCFFRSVIPNTKFEIRHSAGRAVVDGEGMGGYAIDADGSAVTINSKFIPLKVISETGTAIVAPGEKYDPKGKKVLRLPATEAELTLMQLDELRALAEVLSPEEDLKAKP
jgi:hypothetical protein